MMAFPSPPSDVAPLPTDIADEEIDSEEVKIYLEEQEVEDTGEDVDSTVAMIEESLNDFPEHDNSPAAQAAAEIAKAHITAGTHHGHVRIIVAYVTYHRKQNPSWSPLEVTAQTPYDIRAFIQQKCGDKSAGLGFEGRKFATAVSTRAALTMWYRSVRRNESTTEWKVDEHTGACSGLPTRSRAVAEFMVGLEKTKVRAGDVSRSARALSHDDMRRLYRHCLRSAQSANERRWGVMRFSVYLLAFLMVLRMDEALKITFEYVDNIPDDTEGLSLSLGPRKTSQTGNAHVWCLSANDRDEEMCPKRIFLMLAELYGADVYPCGPLFHYVNQRGVIELDRPLTTGVIHRALMADMQALGYSSWALYGTHSFRRGGCQYRVENGWTVAEVAAWGGWTQIEAVTMYRYFYSPNDNHEFMRQYDRNLPKYIN